MKNKSSFWKEFIKALAISIALASVIRIFIIQPFKVQGASMEPVLAANNYLIIDEISYRFRGPERGEIIVFKHGSDFFVKRIIALPGETIEIKNNKIFINSQFLEDNTSGNLQIVLSDEQYFVLGDNRQASSDSRAWGPVKKQSIIGRVWLRVLPLNKLEKFNVPADYKISSAKRHAGYFA